MCVVGDRIGIDPAQLVPLRAGCAELAQPRRVHRDPCPVGESVMQDDDIVTLALCCGSRTVSRCHDDRHGAVVAGAIQALLPQGGVGADRGQQHAGPRSLVVDRCRDAEYPDVFRLG